MIAHFLAVCLCAECLEQHSTAASKFELMHGTAQHSTALPAYLCALLPVRAHHSAAQHSTGDFLHALLHHQVLWGICWAHMPQRHHHHTTKGQSCTTLACFGRGVYNDRVLVWWCHSPLFWVGVSPGLLFSGVGVCGFQGCDSGVIIHELCKTGPFLQ
jgi:hypothetical protein